MTRARNSNLGRRGLDQDEKDALIEAIKRNDGNVSEAARELGIGRQAVEAFIHHPYDGRTTSLSAWF